jgi:hypothetical protein
MKKKIIYYISSTLFIFIISLIVFSLLKHNQDLLAILLTFHTGAIHALCWKHFCYDKKIIMKKINHDSTRINR